MKHAIYIPLMGPLADPHAVTDIAGAAEQSGWDGLFVWDHVLHGEWAVADPWIALSAAAVVTDRIRLGPMVTPLPRRRVIKLARETVTLDRLSSGRLILGLGIGHDGEREYSAFGENPDAHRLGQLLDEGTAALIALWAGETVEHRGAIVVEDVHAIPGPVQQPRIPLWFGTGRTSGKPIERAGRHDGIFPVGVDVAGVAGIADAVRTARGGRDGFDIAVMVGRGDHPELEAVSRRVEDLDALAAAGATWAMHAFWPGQTPDQVLQVIERGPAR